MEIIGVIYSIFVGVFVIELFGVFKFIVNVVIFWFSKIFGVVCVLLLILGIKLREIGVLLFVGII